jgi:hypothetical protein
VPRPARLAVTALALFLASLPASASPPAAKPGPKREVAVPVLTPSGAKLTVRVSLPARPPALKRPAVVARKRPPVPPPVLRAIEVTPAQVSLAGPSPERQLLVTGLFSDGERRDLTDVARYVATVPGPLRVSRTGLLRASGDGTGRVRVTVGAAKAWVKVAAQGVMADTAPRFLADVVPVLTRAGCNQGACHGALAGKGGFRLSLLGYDAESDYRTIVREALGRRINRAAPERSLLLLKATLTISHAGGLRFRRDSHEYELLADWLARGAPEGKTDGPEVASVEVQPAERLAQLPETGTVVPVAIPQESGRKPVLLRLPVRQRLAVTARLQDGTTEDITRRAQYNSLNDPVASVDGDGRVTLQAKGQTAVMVRFRGKAAVCRLMMPYGKPSAVTGMLPQANFIDRLVAARWRQMGLSPSQPCTDAEFIRRVYLDVLGILPTPDEVRAFLKECSEEQVFRPSGVQVLNPGSPPKPNLSTRAAQPRTPEHRGGREVVPAVSTAARGRLIDRVLDRPEYADYWTLKWGDLLRNNRAQLGEKGMWSFHNWLRASFRANKPLDAMTRELVTAQGSTYTNGPANYFRVVSAPADLAETTAQVFLGVRLACAKCHHHPFEKWSQDDYWQMAAFFSRVGLKGSDEFGIFGGEQVVRLASSGEVANPRTGQQMKPAPLDGKTMDDPVDRRRALATWLTAPENPFFARNIVNRYWAYLMGRGIVDPVDDLRVTNPPSNPELLDALAQDFAAHRFDVKHLLKTILTSATYQLSSTPTRENRQDELFYTKYTVKRLPAEVLLDAVCAASGSPEKFSGLPAGYRAAQLPDPGVQSYFLDTFGRPGRNLACECERSAEPNMAQALHLMNSDFIQNKVASGSGRLAKLLEAKKPDPEIVEELYLATFSRLPTPAEREKALQLVAEAPAQKEGFEDLLWALLNSREFVFNH